MKNIYEVTFIDRKPDVFSSDRDLLVIAHDVPTAYDKAYKYIIKNFVGQEIIAVKKLGTIDVQ